MKTDSLSPAFTCITIFCLLFVVPLEKAGAGTISVNFRFDDAGSQAGPDNLKMLIEVFTEAGVPCTFGIIPFHRDETDSTTLIPLTRETIEILRGPAAAGVIEPALHGYLHESHSLPWKSEFAGVPYPDQLKWISSGKQVLDEAFGTETAVFIPPYNRYDGNTVKALRENGIGIVSGSAEHALPDDCPRYLVPLCCKTHIIKNVVRAAQKSHDRSAVITAYFHISRITPGNNTLPYISQEYLRETIAWLKSQPGVEICTLQEIAGQSDLGKNRYLANYRLRQIAALIPPPFAESRYPYFSVETARKYALILSLKLAAMMPATVVFVSVVVFYLNRLFLARITGSIVLRISVLLLPVFAAAFFTLFALFSWRTVIIASLMIGIVTGTLGEFLRQKGRRVS